MGWSSDRSWGCAGPGAQSPMRPDLPYCTGPATDITRNDRERLSAHAERAGLGMSDLYHVLGLRPGAADEEIRSAFRSLAKQLHPDLNRGDADAERRLRDVISAYQ